ncbi:MAG: pilus (MSHA type) biogenesis protein MshL [Pseudomonadales bacterium]
MKRNLIAVSVCAAFLTGCAASMPRGPTSDSEIDELLDEIFAMRPEPAVVEPEPASPGGAKPSTSSASDERFDVNTDATPARAFLMALVDGTPYNMVVHPDLTGSISLSLKGVTVPEVLDVISKVYGYAHEKSATGFIVMPATLQSRIYQVDYPNLQRSGVSRTRVSSGQVSEARSRGSGSSQYTQDAYASGAGQARGSQEFSGSRIETNYKADFWTELQVTLEAIVGNSAGSRVVVNAQTGVVVVRAMHQQQRIVEDYLEVVESIAQRQVIIEAKIIEVQLNDRFQAGINWVAVAENSSGDTFTFSQNVPEEDSTGDVPLLGSAFSMAFDMSDFSMFIELLEEQGTTRVLSSPRVSTLNNQKAVIKAGTDEFFVTDIASNTVTGTSSSTSRDIQLTPFFSGIALDVTPQISADGEIIMHIHPTVSTVTDQQKVITVSGESDTVPLAFSEIRESDSIVKATSGQIIVIGGLMRNSTRTETFGTPVLGRIPGVGRLFRSEREIEQKTELVILLKPILADDQGVWRDMATDSLQRMQTLATQ